MSRLSGRLHRTQWGIIILTGLVSEIHCDKVTPSRFRYQVHGLVHIADEMDEESERFTGSCLTCVLINPALQHTCHVLDSVEDVDVLFTIPAARTRETACLPRVIAKRVDVVHRSIPISLVFVRPSRNWGKVALGFLEEFTDGFENVGLDIHLRDGRDNLMAYVLLLVVFTRMLIGDRDKPSNPHACAAGKNTIPGMNSDKSFILSVREGIHFPCSAVKVD